MSKRDSLTRNKTQALCYRPQSCEIRACNKPVRSASALHLRARDAISADTIARCLSKYRATSKLFESTSLISGARPHSSYCSIFAPSSHKACTTSDFPRHVASSDTFVSCLPRIVNAGRPGCQFLARMRCSPEVGGTFVDGRLKFRLVALGIHTLLLRNSHMTIRGPSSM
jgi:hypothetical protein